ncbi:hypothetical protein IKQ38_00635 [Candidatus Saccharibacteria bacterium]|nr:hypothetical protein [Candidatus Saccharibacteria bacterium]
MNKYESSNSGQGDTGESNPWKILDGNDHSKDPEWGADVPDIFDEPDPDPEPEPMPDSDPEPEPMPDSGPEPSPEPTPEPPEPPTPEPFPEWGDDDMTNAGRQPEGDHEH